MENIQPYLDGVLAFMRQGFNEANQTHGLLIALAATIFMQSWRQWFPVALFAVVIHIAIDVLIPVFASRAPLLLPPLMEGPFWQMAGARFVGYAIVIGIFFTIKRLLFRARPSAH